jgi:hypothetical protein
MSIRFSAFLPRVAVAAALVAGAAAVGCGMAEGPREKLQHTAFSFNEGLRWGRDADVLPRVDPPALAEFRARHAGWGTDVQVSGVEILQSVVDDKLDKAAITVKYTWYKNSEMVVNDTVTLQHWERRKGEWWMVAEEHQSGTPF